MNAYKYLHLRKERSILWKENREDIWYKTALKQQPKKCSLNKGSGNNLGKEHFYIFL